MQLLRTSQYREQTKGRLQGELKHPYDMHKEPVNLRSTFIHTEKCETLPNRLPEGSNSILKDFIDTVLFRQCEHFCKIKPASYIKPS